MINVNWQLFYLTILFWIGSFVNLFSSEIANELHYVVKPVVEEKSLKIELIFQGNDDGLTEIEIPISWTGKPFEEIVNLEFFSKEKKLEVDNTSSLDSIIIFHKPCEEIKIKYDVINLNEQQDIRSAYSQEETFFRFTGDCVLITPKWDSYEKRNIVLEWKDIPSTWSIANSFGIHETMQELTLSIFSLRLGFFIGGEISIIQSGDGENSPYVAMKDAQLLSKDRLLPLLGTIVQSQRDFWNDNDFSHFLIVIIPSDAGQGIHAEAKLNAFAIFFPPLTNENEEEWNSLTWVLTHEHFHTWNPFKMLPTLPENFDSLAWFTEGFTEYYTAVLSYRAQTLDLDSCISEINNFLYSYYTSPFRNVTNDRFQEERWKDMRMQLLAYQRGCLLALLWDSKIREKTAEKYSLDNVMRDLLQRVKETGNPILVKDIEELVGKYLGSEQASLDIQNYIMDGKTIVPSNDIFVGYLEIQWFEDIGLNLDQTQKSGVIKGVVEDSNAYKAGLRNGQKFKCFYRNAEGLVSVTVNDNSSEREISYIPNQGGPIPQYAILSNVLSVH